MLRFLNITANVYNLYQKTNIKFDNNFPFYQVYSYIKSLKDIMIMKLCVIFCSLASTLIILESDCLLI